MKIQANNRMYNVNQKWTNSIKKSNTLYTSANATQVEMSASSKLLKECVEKAKGLDQVREQRVQELKKQIESGTYQVSSEVIAKAMVEDGFFLN